MDRNKIIILAVVALVAFQGDQLSHAIDASKNADSHIHDAPAGPPSFANASFARSHFDAPGAPCEDLGHSEADCPLANIVDSFDITGTSDLSVPAQVTRLEVTKHSLTPNEVEHNRQIRGPPVHLV